VSADRPGSWFHGSSDSKDFSDKRVELACTGDLHECFEGVAFHLETCFQYGAYCPLPLFRHRKALPWNPYLIRNRGLSGYRKTPGLLSCNRKVGYVHGNLTHSIQGYERGDEMVDHGTRGLRYARLSIGKDLLGLFEPRTYG